MVCFVFKVLKVFIVFNYKLSLALPQSKAMSDGSSRNQMKGVTFSNTYIHYCSGDVI